MTDFHQTGVITTLHRLVSDRRDGLEAEIGEFGKEFPIALVLPCLYSELEGPALPNMVKELGKVSYLNEVVVALGRATKDQFDFAKKFFAALPQDVRILWTNGPRIEGLCRYLTEAGVDIGMPGKGQSCWLAYGYVLARGRSRMVALQDCDVLRYDREMLARLCYPVASQSMGYIFCKGYYARVTDRMHGRVTRLFVTPLIRSLDRVLGGHPLLTFLDSFRYPLAGEIAMTVELARNIRIPGDWGLEIGSLAEVYRNDHLRRICQSEIATTYDHKHQVLSAGDASQGLMKMVVDISKSLFRNLAIEGVILNESLFNTVLVSYLRSAQDAIKKYDDDARINGLFFDLHDERLAVEAFTRGIRLASEEFIRDPLGTPMISNWNRVVSAIPSVFHMLEDAVEADLK